MVSGAVGVLGLGFVLGLSHALDADHVVAVSTLSARSGSFRSASLLGAFWGVGHTLTLLLAGLAVFLLQVRIPTSLSVIFELVIAGMLILLGAQLLFRLGKEKWHIHTHKHDGKAHVHWHSHKNASSHEHAHMKTAVIVGMLHGLAGSSAVMLLVLATITQVWVALEYILIFGFGSILGMTAISFAISIPFASKRLSGARTAMSALAACASVFVGVQLAIALLPLIF